MRVPTLHEGLRQQINADTVDLGSLRSLHGSKAVLSALSALTPSMLEVVLRHTYNPNAERREIEQYRAKAV